MSEVKPEQPSVEDIASRMAIVTPDPVCEGICDNNAGLIAII